MKSKNPKTVAIVTARGGNKSMPDKNIISIGGHPTVSYPIEAAKQAGLVDEVFVTTECEKIKKVGIEYGAKIIDRPAHLSQSDTNHGDVIIHAAQAVKEQYHDLEVVVILLGNTVTLDGAAIDESIKVLMSDRELDSCMTVWKAQDDHPYRAMRVNDSGYLESYLGGENISTNRQTYPDIYFYDQGPWTVRYSTLCRCLENEEKGPSPWWWMGKKCKGLERGWITGRDFHSPLDLWLSEKWIMDGRKDETFRRI